MPRPRLSVSQLFAEASTTASEELRLQSEREAAYREMRDRERQAGRYTVSPSPTGNFSSGDLIRNGITLDANQVWGSFGTIDGSYDECPLCDKKLPDGSRFTVYDHNRYCEDCYKRHFKKCGVCENMHPSSELYTGFNDDDIRIHICDDCSENGSFFTCDRCDVIRPIGQVMNSNNVFGEFCSECVSVAADEQSSRNAHGFSRKYYDGDKFTDPEHRAYSCEIECYYPEPEAFKKVIESIPQEVGCCYDGSLGSNGKEFQTPKLSGEKGDALLKNLCKQLNDNKFSVDKRCGLHIHLDTVDIIENVDIIKNIALFYMAFEPVIYSFLPYSRRISRYCRPLTEFYHDNEIRSISDRREFENLWYREQDMRQIAQRKKDRHDQSRYSGVNLHSLLANGHIEFRHHSGTLDYEKINNWIILHTTIINLLAFDQIDQSVVRSVRHMLELKDKSEAMFKLLKLPSSVEKYFRARSEKFGGALTEEISCVE